MVDILAISDFLDCLTQRAPTHAGSFPALVQYPTTAVATPLLDKSTSA